MLLQGNQLKVESVKVDLDLVKWKEMLSFHMDLHLSLNNVFLLHLIFLKC